MSILHDRFNVSMKNLVLNKVSARWVLLCFCQDNARVHTWAISLTQSDKLNEFVRFSRFSKSFKIVFFWSKITNNCLFSTYY